MSRAAPSPDAFACWEGSRPQGREEYNLIKKGENEKTYLITTKTEKQIESSLRLKAVLMVIIGVGLIVGGVALFLHMRHML